MDANTAPETREERFCRAYVRLPLAIRATLFAGYDPSEAEEAAHRLLTREDIQNRIALLRHEQAWRQCHDMDAMLSKLQALYEQAMAATQYGPALRALTLQARIAVLVDDRGRGTQGRRQRPVSWAWKDLSKQVGPEPATPSLADDDDCWAPDPEAGCDTASPDTSFLEEEAIKREYMSRYGVSSGPPEGDGDTSGDSDPDSRPIPLYAGASTAWPSDRTSVSRAATRVSKNTSFPSTHKCVVSSSPG